MFYYDIDNFKNFGTVIVTYFHLCTILKFLFRIQCIRFFHENNFISDRAQNDLNQNWREVIFCSNGDIRIASNCHDLKYCIQRVCFESYLECVN